MTEDILNNDEFWKELGLDVSELEQEQPKAEPAKEAVAEAPKPKKKKKKKTSASQEQKKSGKKKKSSGKAARKPTVVGTVTGTFLKTVVVVLENGVYSYYEHEKLPNSCHGTGDIYASSFVGALVRGKTAFDAAKIAADYTVACIQATAKEENHWYGAAFEPVLPELIRALN